MSQWDFFSIDEFRCRCGCEKAFMNEAFVDQLDRIRFLCQFPLIVSSGFRCSAHNMAVSTTGKHGPHTTGRAVDIQIYGERALRLIQLATDQGMTGVGVHQKGPYGKRFIHLDNLEAINRQRPHIWTY